MVPVTSLPPIELYHFMKFYKILFHPVVFMLCSKQEKVSKGNNSVINLIRVMDLVHCTSLPHVPSICEVSFQYL